MSGLTAPEQTAASLGPQSAACSLGSAATILLPFTTFTPTNKRELTLKPPARGRTTGQRGQSGEQRALPRDLCTTWALIAILSLVDTYILSARAADSSDTGGNKMLSEPSDSKTMKAAHKL